MSTYQKLNMLFVEKVVLSLIPNSPGFPDLIKNKLSGVVGRADHHSKLPFLMSWEFDTKIKHF